MSNLEHILVTGGAGFIGSHLTEHLLGQGHRVTVLDNFSTGRYENLLGVVDQPGLLVLPGDVTGDINPLVRFAVRAQGAVTGVAHLAAQTSVTASLEDPLLDAQTNHVGLLRVLEFARESAVKRLVFSSSAAVYGDLPEGAIPSHEGLSTAPLSPYGVHKLSGELLCLMYARTHGLSAVPLRFFNVYGPRQDPSSPYSGVISVFIQRVLSQRPITIFGDGLQTRDFVFVSDVVQAVSRALTAASVQAAPLNVGTGVEISVAALAQTLHGLAATHLPAHALPPVSHAPARQGEILRSCADIQKILKELNFSPKVSIREGLQQTLLWLLEKQTIY